MASVESPPPAAPVIKTRRGVSPVWLVPIIALAIGAWLIYHTLSERGPDITIEFEHAGGLEAGKTKIKFKNVEIGKLTTIELSDDLSHVLVNAQLTKRAKPYLKSDTRFWVVRPRIERSGVSGLSTLVSGAYIAIDPGTASSEQNHFVGLEAPPLIDSDVAGRHFILEAESRGSLALGSPVYVRDLEAGEVTSVNLAPGGELLEIGIFVASPYHELVYPTTRFWNASGIDLSIDADGVDVRIASLESLLTGGIAFETSAPTDSIAGNNTRFRLYSTRDEIDDVDFTKKISYVMYFDGSVRGLSIDAPVEFRGIKIGAVRRISAEFDPQARDVRIPVIVDIEPERIDRLLPPSQTTEDSAQTISSLVDLGLRAQLQTGSLLTGKLFIALDLRPETPPRLVGDHTLPELPTIPTILGQFEKAATSILTKLEAVPLDELSNNLTALTQQLRILLAEPALKETIVGTRDAVASIDRLVGDINAELIPKFQDTLRSYDQHSAVYQQLAKAVAEVEAAAVAVRALAEELERAPESLIRGKR